MIWQVKEKDLGTLSQTLSSSEGSRSVITDLEQKDVNDMDVKGKMNEQKPLTLDIRELSA